MDEEWRPVVGYEGLYEVSDQGRIRSLPRYVPLRGELIRKQEGRIKKPTTRSSDGRVQITLWKNGERKLLYTYRLVLEAFCGPCPPNHEACHWDDDPSNNTLKNLRWGTQSDNQKDRIRNGNHNNVNKTRCPQGHEYSPENTYINPKGSRECRTCMRDRSRRNRTKQG